MKALLLVGSPRLAGSTSETLGGYLLERLGESGVETEKLYVQRALRSGEELDAQIAAVARCDVLIFSSPLYVDNLPAPVIRLLEILAGRLDEHTRVAAQRLLAISNCGFPEARHNDVALAIYERFARETGFVWAGGLALGAGEPVKNQSLAGGGGLVRNVVKALDLSAQALARGEVVGEEAERLMREPLMPAGIYRFMGDLGWRMRACRHGTLWKLRQTVWEGR
jgi:hypothetical protein